MNRIISGTVKDSFECDFNDGLPPEHRVDVDLPGPGTWEFPLSWFMDAGYEESDVQSGLRFKAETITSVGMVPKSWERIVPKIDRGN